ncbi:hypothetical protein HK096_001919, partial [Nowakowskiella sp. JEL0078]
MVLSHFILKQLATNIPDRKVALWPTAALKLIDNTNTDAMILLTVYPVPDPYNITLEDVDRLALLCAGVNEAGRKIFLRFAPEMNGNWQVYGQQASLFKTLYIQIAKSIRSRTNLTAMVWSPNEGSQYPYGINQYTPTSRSVITELDTNKNGQLDSGDDPYAPYY